MRPLVKRTGRSSPPPPPPPPYSSPAPPPSSPSAFRLSFRRPVAAPAVVSHVSYPRCCMTEMLATQRVGGCQRKNPSGGVASRMPVIPHLRVVFANAAQPPL